MIDARAARNEPDEFRHRLARKGAAEEFDTWLAADERWRELVPRVDELRSRTKLKGKPTPEQLEELRGVKEELQRTEQELSEAEATRDEVGLRIPNLPADDVPDGATEDDVRVERVVGEPPRLIDPKESIELGHFDMERAARMSGARFGYWIGDTGRLALALYRYALDRLAAKGFVTILPPVLVREEALIGTGAFPSDEQNVYEIPEDGLYLSATAEIPVASLHAGEILEAETLPLRYVAFSPCFRREAGAAGKDTRGILRVHQFDKVEMVLFERPGESEAALEWMTERAEILLQRLGLAYRVILMATRELGFVQAKKYDLETWAPGVERWLEVSSCSNFRDYQARRMAIRFRPEPGAKPELVHTLNGSGLALARIVATILETYQQPDGSVRVPDVLQPYVRSETL